MGEPKYSGLWVLPNGDITTCLAGDDPLLEEAEMYVPAATAVQVLNDAYGDAHDWRKWRTKPPTENAWPEPSSRLNG